MPNDHTRVLNISLSWEKLFVVCDDLEIGFVLICITLVSVMGHFSDACKVPVLNYYK